MPPIKLDEKEKEDVLYNRVHYEFNRVQKILTSHTQAIDSLEKNLETLTSKADASAERLGQLVERDSENAPS